MHDELERLMALGNQEAQVERLQIRNQQREHALLLQLTLEALDRNAPGDSTTGETASAAASRWLCAMLRAGGDVCTGLAARSRKSEVTFGQARHGLLV